MANIQPFDYQKSTNIEEHNQIVNKVNEIVEVINNVNLDTINSEIATLQTKATETDTEIANIKDKDTAQDTEINGITKNLVSNVTATFDNPSRELKISLGREASPSIDATVVIPASSETGQYSAGNGITIENYQIAVDTNVVALKTDIPDVPAIDDLTQRVSTLETEMPTKASVDDVNALQTTVTDLSGTVAGKVAIAQGVENAGKVLGIGSDGNVTPVDAGGSSGGGEVWEELDINNLPTDFQAGDRIKLSVKVIPYLTYNINSWSTAPSQGPSYMTRSKGCLIIELSLNESGNGYYIPLCINFGVHYITAISISDIGSYTVFNDDSNTLITINKWVFNGGGSASGTNEYIKRADMGTFFDKIWRCRASQ